MIPSIFDRRVLLNTSIECDKMVPIKEEWKLDIGGVQELESLVNMATGRFEYG